MRSIASPVAPGSRLPTGDTYHEHWGWQYVELSVLDLGLWSRDTFREVFHLVEVQRVSSLVLGCKGQGGILSDPTCEPCMLDPRRPRRIIIQFVEALGPQLLT